MLCLSLACGFTACGDDDDDDNGGGGKAPETPVATFAGKLLANISSRYDNDGYTFSYDDKGRLTQVSEGNYYTMTIDYDKNTLTEIEEDGSATYNLSFNADGYLTSMNGSYHYSYSEGDEESGTGRANYSYDGSGHITKMTGSGSTTYKEDGYSYKATTNSSCVFTWTNGNLVKWSGESTYSGGLKYIGTSTFTYGNESNATRQYTVRMAEEVGMSNRGTTLAGLFGIGSANLPVSCIYEEKEESPYEEPYIDTDTDNYSFTLNADGTINTERVDNYETYYYSYINPSEAQTAAPAVRTRSLDAPAKAVRHHALFWLGRHARRNP